MEKMPGHQGGVLKHFSHQHPLVTFVHQPAKGDTHEHCACCKDQFAEQETIYSCNKCGYHLHLLCTALPTSFTHAFHVEHDVCLVSEGEFSCEACGENDDGFSYRCEECKVALHPACAALPVILKHVDHAHQLNLTFEIAGPSGRLTCGACGGPGGGQWVYRCGSCGFDVHLECAKKGRDREPAWDVAERVGKGKAIGGSYVNAVTKVIGSYVPGMDLIPESVEMTTVNMGTKILSVMLKQGKRFSDNGEDQGEVEGSEEDAQVNGSTPVSDTVVKGGVYWIRGVVKSKKALQKGVKKQSKGVINLINPFASGKPQHEEVGEEVAIEAHESGIEGEELGDGEELGGVMDKLKIPSAKVADNIVKVARISASSPKIEVGKKKPSGNEEKKPSKGKPLGKPEKKHSKGIFGKLKPFSSSMMQGQQKEVEEKDVGKGSGWSTGHGAVEIVINDMEPAETGEEIDSSGAAVAEVEVEKGDPNTGRLYLHELE